MLERLVTLVNEDLDTAHSAYAEKLGVIDAELKNVNSRLTMLYDALETGKLGLNDLAPRIKELKRRQDELLKARVLLEADITLHGVLHVDAEQVKSYACDLRSLLTETDITKSKAFLRSFVEKIVIHGTTGTIYYKLPVPAHWQERDEVVLPIVPPSGEGGTVPELLFEKKELIPMLQQLLISYHT